MNDSSPASPAARLADDLQSDWSTSAPGSQDIDDLVDLLERKQRHITGTASASYADIAAAVVGRGAAVRRHLLVRDPTDRAMAWATVHDRAAGRVLLDVVVDPDLATEVSDPLARLLFAWGESEATSIAHERELDLTQVDSGSYARDERQHRWLASQGFEKTRTWWQMSRPVTASEGLPGGLPAPQDEVVIRRVRRGRDGMPDEDDLRTVHDVLETSFADHFNTYAEPFDEFVSRLREDPGHRWDHWWIAEVRRKGADPEPAGALVGSALAGARSDDGPPWAVGSYVDYIGVLPSARGRGVAKALLHAVIADAAKRGRDRVGLEVDADSPTGAEGLYTSLGWTTSYITESWHRDIPVQTAAP